MVLVPLTPAAWYTPSAMVPPQVARAAPPLVVPFAAIRDDVAPLVGGKAASLAALRGAGLPVPDGFCLTTEAMRLFIREGGLTERLAEIEKKATEGKTFEIGVKFDDGTTRTFHQDTHPSWTAGSRVKLVNGALTPL